MSAPDYAGLGWQQTLVLASALRLGLLGEMVNGATPAEAADELGLDRRGASAVLGALCEMGVLVEEGEGYALREEHRRTLLEPDNEAYAGAFLLDLADQISTWTRLPQTLRYGGPVQDHTAPEEITGEFIERMRREAAPAAEPTARELLSRLPRRARVLDAGGGPGAIAEPLSRGGARVTVFDLPEVISLVRRRLEQAGTRAEAGDMNESLPEGPFDAVYLGHTSHMYGPEENRALFRRIYGALAPGGLLAVRDFVRGESAGAEMFAVNMLLFTPRGSTYTAREYRRWIEAAGFGEFELVRVPGRDTHLVLGRRPVAPDGV